MRMKKASIKWFRKLKEVEVEFDKFSTIIVGRNNSGKTSLTEVFYKFLKKGAFSFDDFSMDSYLAFEKAHVCWNEKLAIKKEDEDAMIAAELELRSVMPYITLSIEIEYEEHDDLSSLSPFIMDLDVNRKDALITCMYGLKDFDNFFSEFGRLDDEIGLIEFFKKHQTRFCSARYYAVDKENPENRREIESLSFLNKVFLTKFIYAQVRLDDQSIDNSKGLSKGFEDFYRNTSDTSDDVTGIENLLSEISTELDDKYKDVFKVLYDDLNQFGAGTGFPVQKLAIKSNFSPEGILKGNTTVYYENEINLLPESHNGLGFSKLIYLVLQFISYYEEYKSLNPRPMFQVLFIEEPEAHLHPQMQHVFIKNIENFIKTKLEWEVQIVITTHSSHVIAEGDFSSIRYFDVNTSNLQVKNLLNFKDKIKAGQPETLRFLKQYLSLSKCDLFFADLIILVEGTVERLLIPEMIRRKHLGLLNKYISIIEIGGAYMQRFKELLEFIGAKTLLITDLDSVDTESKEKCEVLNGAITSNSTLKTWVPCKERVADLLSTPVNEKIVGVAKQIRVSYQCPEEGMSKCGRSFEEAFILANPDSLVEYFKSGTRYRKVFNGSDITKDSIVNNSYELADRLPKKTEFAFDILGIDYVVPKYIRDGLNWLEKEESANV